MRMRERVEDEVGRERWGCWTYPCALSDSIDATLVPSWRSEDV